VTAPAGWVEVLRTQRGEIAQVTYYRLATAAEPMAHEFAFSRSLKAAGAISRFTGVDAADPIVSADGWSGDSKVMTAPDVTAEDKSLLVSLFGFNAKNLTLTVPAGMTGRYNAQNPKNLTISAADEPRETGMTGVRVSQPAPLTSNKWIAQNIVLRLAQ